MGNRITLSRPRCDVSLVDERLVVVVVFVVFVVVFVVVGTLASAGRDVSLDVEGTRDVAVESIAFTVSSAAAAVVSALSLAVVQAAISPSATRHVWILT